MQGYQMKITIRGSKPPVWRRILIPKDMTFYQLHKTLQYLFGWMDVHAYDFKINKLGIRVVRHDDPTDDISNTLIDEDHCLFEYLNEGSKMIYTYDFGDEWKHMIVVEKEIEMEEAHPVLIKWKGDNYAEEAGNVTGYENILKDSMDPSHPEQEEIKGWLENNHIDFDEKFVKRMLKMIVINEPQMSMDPMVSKELDDALIQLREAFSKKHIENLSLIIKETDDHTSYIGFNQMLDNITLQIYDNETDYLQGVDFVASGAHGNIYANAICIISSKYPFDTDSWVSKDQTTIIKCMKTGYLPRDLTTQEAIASIQEIHELREVIQTWKKKKFPTYDTNECLYATWKKDHFIVEKKPIRLHADRTILHIHPRDKIEIEEQAAHRKGITKVDLIPFPSHHNREMDVILTMEGNLINGDQTLDRSCLQNFMKMNEEILYHMCDFIYEDGIPDKILVNNENMRFILSGLCEDLAIKISVEPFMTQTEKDLLKDPFEDHDEEDLEILETMAGMGNEEFFDFVQSMRPEEMADFQEFLKKYIDLDELEKIFEDIEDLDLLTSKKKTFDA